MMKLPEWDSYMKLVHNDDHEQRIMNQLCGLRCPDNTVGALAASSSHFPSTESRRLSLTRLAIADAVHGHRSLLKIERVTKVRRAAAV